jgi:hypothetical protein
MRIKVTSLAILHQKRGMGYINKESERIKEQKVECSKKKRERE